MKQLVRLVIGFSLGLVVLTGCVPPPFFGPGPEHHEDHDHDRGPDRGPEGHHHGDDFHGEHGRDYR